MMARPPKETLILDMPFGEALERFVGVAPGQLQASIAKGKRKKPTAPKKRPKRVKKG
jgi:hypothetical protein